MHNPVCGLFKIKYPVIQAGMVWCSGWKLASEVSEAGGLGLIGAGSMYPEVLREHIRKCKQATKRPFGVNVPLIYPDLESILKVIEEEGVSIVFTSAGNPAKYTGQLRDQGIMVAHVVASVRSAMKCEEAGVDVIVAEGFEAGGHNGKEETTTMVLVPTIRKMTGKPLIAAGGISTGRAMLAAMALGADGVQVGSRFAVSKESSAHARFKQRVIEAGDGDTRLVLKQHVPVRLLRNQFYERVKALEEQGASVDELKDLLGKGRAKRGIFEGDLEEGELEIGQVAGLIDAVKPARQIMKDILEEYEEAKRDLCSSD